MWLAEKSAQWDHTAAIITHIRLSAGDKSAKSDQFHPFKLEQPDKRKLFKKLHRGEKLDESDHV